MNHLIERCEISDAALAPLIAFEGSYLDGGAGIIDLVREFAPQIAINAGLVLNLLARLAI